MQDPRGNETRSACVATSIREKFPTREQLLLFLFIKFNETGSYISVTRRVADHKPSQDQISPQRLVPVQSLCKGADHDQEL